MKVTQEKLPASQVGLEIEITAEMAKSAYEKVIQEFTRSANIPGFRKGKIPRQVLIQRIGSTRLKAAAVENLIDSSLKEAIEQEQISVVGNMQLRSPFDDLVSQFDPAAPLVFSVSVDVHPEVTLESYIGLQVRAEEIKPEPDRVDQTLEQYRQQIATLVPIESRPAQLKDVVVIDYKGVLVSDDAGAEPEPLPGGEANDFQLELEEGRFIKGFIDGIIGMKLDETKEVLVKFPDDYANGNLAGRSVIFTITLKEIKEKELPPLDDEFAEEVSDFKTLEELRESLENRYSKEAEEKTKANKQQAILMELLHHVEVELPETLVDREVIYLLNQTAMQFQNQGLDVRQIFTEETVPVLKERSRPEAIDRIKLTLALSEIAKRESIDVDPEEVQTSVNRILAELNNPKVDRERVESTVTEDLLREKILDWLIEKSIIELVPEGTLATETKEAVEAAVVVEEPEETGEAEEAESKPAASSEARSPKHSTKTEAES